MTMQTHVTITTEVRQMIGSSGTSKEADVIEAVSKALKALPNDETLVGNVEISWNYDTNYLADFVIVRAVEEVVL